TYSNVEFKKFGVTLDVLPLVDERNTITLDVKPEFSQPDLQLTRQITDATGTNTQTTAFNTRSLETRTQVRDGQPLVIGGLISRSDRDTESYTPGLNRVPLLSPVIKGSGKSDNSTELVIIVTPTVVQKPIDEVALWQYPPLEELMRTSIGLPAPDSLPKGMHPREKGRVVGTDMTEMR
ncbi:MAG: type II and III secretion system protein, partial [Pseudomonas sp.]|nr:type II and III secretion system protein [Pseudomonas sp.]